jgi:alkyl hydroperoxide reductase subunit AhpC/predicted Ser/Thr protein kinase
MTTAMVGQLAPDFDLERTNPPGFEPGRARLADYRGRWLVMVFYPRDFSLVCPTEMTSLGDHIEQFRSNGAEIVGISTDSVESHERWVSLPKSQGGLGGLSFPLASDSDGSVARSYGVYLEYQNVALRGLFLVDPNGVLQYQVVHNMSVGRKVEEVLRVLAAIQTGGLCGEGWTPEHAAEKRIDPTQVLAPGRVVAHYRVEDVVGSGSFATVYRARDLTLDRDVALKVFKDTNPAKAKAAITEARAAASLSHPNICTIFAVEDAEGASMIAMEYLHGRTLADYVNDGPMQPETVSRVIRQVAHGMSVAHARGLIHGDLKPANIMIGPCGQAKVLDFGLSRRESPLEKLDFAVDATATYDSTELEPSGLSGTPSYMAPEQARGDRPSSASDVFALGVITYELLTAHKAFPGKNLLQVLNQIARVDPDRLAADLPAPFDDLVRRTLNPDPDDRDICMKGIFKLLADPNSPIEAALA